MLLNLLGNAIKFTSRGSVTFRVTRLAQTSAPSHAFIRFEVSDTGPGIAKEQLGIIFSPFSQLARYSRAIEGTGLGLALCQRIVRLMGGELSVTSELEQGSVFSFELNIPETQHSKPIPLDASRTKTFSIAASQPLPSQDTLRQLIEYAEIGDILALRQEGERLAQNAELYPFAMQLQQYTNAFQMDKIRAVLTTYLQQGADS